MRSMVSSINGMSRYYGNVNQINRTQSNPMADLVKLSSAKAIYTDRYVKEYDPRLSDYFNTLTKNTYLFKAATNNIQINNADSGFNKKTVTADNDSTIKGTTTPRANEGSYTVNIKNLAEKQTNTSSKLNSNEQPIETGQKSFSIKFGNGTTKNVMFKTDEADTNKSFLSKMATSINGANVGLKAAVVDDTENGTSYLRIEGKTGSKNKFSLEDIEGNAIAKTGSNNITNEARDAELTVDGRKYNSEDNTVKLNYGNVTLNFDKAENKDIKVVVGADKKAAKEGIRNLVNQYNKMIDFSYQYSTEFSGAKNISKELGAVVNTKKAPLESIGITLDKDNKLMIDEKKLEKSLDQDFSRVKNIVSGYDGLTAKMDKKATEIMTNQYKYALPKETNNDSNDRNSYFTQSNKVPYLLNLNLGYMLNTFV